MEGERCKETILYERMNASDAARARRERIPAQPQRIRFRGNRPHRSYKMKTAIITASNHTAIRAVTMHPFVSGAKRYTDDQLDSDGRRALLKIRGFNSRVAATIRNMAEEVDAYGGTDVRPCRNQHKVRLDLLRVAYADSKVPTDLREIVGSFLPEVNPLAQG